MPFDDPTNAPVTSTSPKANPILYLGAVRIIAVLAIRFGISLSDTDVDELVDLFVAAYVVVIEPLISFYGRHRVKPVHSNGTDVVVTPK